jgi:hypothetical protein
MNKYSAFSFLLLQFCIMGYSQACNCSKSTPEQLLDNAKHVFIATIKSSSIDKAESSIVSTFETEDILKGDPSKFNELITGLDSCRFSLQVAEKYLVLLGDNPIVSQCNGTRILNHYHSEEEHQAYLSILRSYINDKIPITRDNSEKAYKQYKIEECKEDTHPLNIEWPNRFYNPVGS